MLGGTHIFVANVALACLPEKIRYILYPRWGGIESGATLSDHFRIMWEPVDANNKEKQLVHRCYIDSNDPKNHGCITRALDHTEGSISFISDYLAGELEGAYNEDEFLENLGMFLGVASHHISDLCTPVHVGSNIDFSALGFPTLKRFHNRVERDIKRFTNKATLQLIKPKRVNICKEFFWNVAQATYEQSFLKLNSIYSNGNEDELKNLASQVISSAIKNTVNVWYTIISSSGMTNRKWSMQPLL